jgi:hypothetical protein
MIDDMLNIVMDPIFSPGANNNDTDQNQPNRIPKEKYKSIFKLPGETFKAVSKFHIYYNLF